jgi:Cdc6-like AAA superfamily ATPase
MVIALNLKELYEKKQNVFKKAEVFDIEYTPTELIARDEAQDIFSRTISFIKSRISQHLFIFGGHGSGKTAYAKYITNQVKDLINTNELNCDIEYMNCRFFKDLWNIPLSILAKNKRDIEMEPEELFIKKLDKDLILILDEIDESEDPSNFFYFISRFQEIQEENKNKIMLILISNKKEWDKTLDSATRSSLALTKIEFKKYDKEQIKEILIQRINDGLENPSIISEEIIQNIADKTINNNSDLRIALKAMRMLITFIEDNKKLNVEEQEVSQVYNEAINRIQFERIGLLENPKFMILYSISHADSDNSRDVYEQYKELSNPIGVKPWGYTRFVHYTNELEDQDFLEINKGKKEGQENIIVNKLKLKIKNEVVNQEFENRQLDFAKNRNSEINS